MKKGQIAEGTVNKVEFPNKGIVYTDEGERIIVKNTIPGQRVSFAVNKVRKGKAEARLLETIKKSPLETADTCTHFGTCGGCTYQSLPYEDQLKIKEEQVRGMMENAIGDACAYEFLPIKHSPRVLAYRNKMEFSFGDAYKDGPLALGMHKRGSFYDIVTVEDCRIVDGDFRTILMATLSYFGEQGISFYHRLRHTGYLRHLLVRKAVKTGEILVDLITTTQEWSNAPVQETDERAKIEAALLEKQGKCPHAGTINEEKEKSLLDGWKDALLALSLEGTLKGVLHTKNDSVADVVKNEGTEVLFGQDYFYEELLGLRFKISPFSFFQTNSLGAEVLYSTAREFILGDNPDMLTDKTVYDLYSGTGTIAQMLAPVCKKVVGVEIIEEAVEAANRGLLEEAGRDAAKAGMGTTVVAATVIGDHLHVANVGDSRLYLINHEAIRQITRDHSLVEEMVRLGEMDKADAKDHPDKNIITRAVGVLPEVTADFFEISLKPGDEILMCSDGLTNMIEDDEIRHIVLGQRDIVEKAEKLIETANRNGGKDNITVVLIEPFSDEVKEC